MYKPELLAPAGDLLRLKIAILYGADAVFVGGKIFSLRAKANNFTIKDIQEGVEFAHLHHAKVYVTVNIVPTQQDFKELKQYLMDLDAIHVDAIIISSIRVLLLAKELKCQFEVHMSTQLSITNTQSVEFFKQLGAKRVVLARELSAQQIGIIKKQTNFPLEVFIHGGMCSSFSGRCTLSNVMVNRDANKGGCAHSCRWIYELYQNNQLVDNFDFTLASSDLMAIDYIPKLIDMKIDSFKIEGRMKSAYYIANVVKIYRQLIDEYLDKKEIKKINLKHYKEEIKKIESRNLTSVFLNKNYKNEGLLLDNGNDNPSQSFLAYVLTDSDEKNICVIEQRNYFTIDTVLEMISPKEKNKTIKILNMMDLDGNKVEIANHAKQILKVQFSKPVKKDSFIRRK